MTPTTWPDLSSSMAGRSGRNWQTPPAGEENRTDGAASLTLFRYARRWRSRPSRSRRSHNSSQTRVSCQTTSHVFKRRGRGRSSCRLRCGRVRMRRTTNDKALERVGARLEFFFDDKVAAIERDFVDVVGSLAPDVARRRRGRRQKVPGPQHQRRTHDAPASGPIHSIVVRVDAGTRAVIRALRRNHTRLLEVLSYSATPVGRAPRAVPPIDSGGDEERTMDHDE